MEFQILTEDKFFSNYTQKEISQHARSSDLRWEYWDEASINKKDLSLIKKWKQNKSILDSSAFVSFLNEHNNFQNKLLGQVKFSITEKFNIKVDKILRSMFVYYPPNPLYPEGSTMIPHVDRTDLPIKNFLYYILENDAPTIFYNFKHTLGSNKINFNPDIYTTVHAKAGRALLFDGSIYHSANVSRTFPRLTLNIIFTEISDTQFT